MKSADTVSVSPPARRRRRMSRCALQAASVWAVAVALATPIFALAQDMIDAEVRKVDRDAGKITLKHGAVKSLDMPAMTMNYAVKDKVALDTVKAGDKVRFKATHEGGRYTVTELQPVR